jgi:hypothetical protein
MSGRKARGWVGGLGEKSSDPVLLSWMTSRRRFGFLREGCLHSSASVRSKRPSLRPTAPSWRSI